MRKNTITKEVRQNRTDLLILCALIGAGYIYSTLTAGTFFGRPLIGGAVFILPGVFYLGKRKPKNWKKILASAAVFGLLYGLFFEFLNEFNNAYAVQMNILPKLFGVVPLDNIVGHFMMALSIFTFYEHFINRNRSKNISRGIWIPVALSSTASVIAIIASVVSPELIRIPYTYLVFGSIAILPPIVLAYLEPKFARDFSLMVPYFFFLFFVIEIVAVRYDWWIYPGSEYVGWVELGTLRYPFEELFFWMLFYPVALVSYYKIFVDRDD